MPAFPPTLEETLWSLQRQIDEINTARPGPTSYGPGDHARFYAADGSTVLFQAVGGVGASVVSRGSLSGLTGLLDGIRDKGDNQDSRLDGHDSAISGLDTRVGAAEEGLDAKANVSSLNGWVSNLQASIATRAAKDYADSISGRAELGITNAQIAKERADSAYSRAGTGIANAATAQARADSAHTRIDGLSYASPGDIATLSNQVQALRSQVHDWMQTARASNPSLPPPIPN